MRSGLHKGTVQSFFTWWDGPNWDYNEWNEIDWELAPSTSETTFTNLYYGTGSYRANLDQYINTDVDLTQFHTYEIEWTPHHVIWRFDNYEVRRVEDPAVLVHLDKYKTLMMNFWVPTFNPWNIDFDPSGWPWQAHYDWVEFSTYNTSNGQFELQWKDEFDSLDDTNRWFVSDGWTFESNDVTFVRSNVFVENGELVL